MEEEEEEGKEDISKKVIMTRTCSLQTHPECEKMGGKEKSEEINHLLMDVAPWCHKWVDWDLWVG